MMGNRAVELVKTERAVVVLETIAPTKLVASKSQTRLQVAKGGEIREKAC